MVVIVEFERCMDNIQILGVVVGKLSYWEESSFIILFIIDKSSEVGLHHTVLPFGLAINLKVESGRDPLLDSKEVT